MNWLSENIPLIIQLLGASGLGGFVIWLLMAKTNLVRDKSVANKDTKISNVEGDTAILNQIDELLTRLANMSNVVIKLQEEVTTLRTNSIQRRAIIQRINNICDTYHEQSMRCDDAINSIKNELKKNATKED